MNIISLFTHISMYTYVYIYNIHTYLYTVYNHDVTALHHGYEPLSNRHAPPKDSYTRGSWHRNKKQAGVVLVYDIRYRNHCSCIGDRVYLVRAFFTRHFHPFNGTQESSGRSVSSRELSVAWAKEMVER